MVTYCSTAIKRLHEYLNSHISQYFLLEIFSVSYDTKVSKIRGSISVYKKASFFWKNIVSRDTGNCLLHPAMKIAARYQIRLLHRLWAVHWSQRTVLSWNICIHIWLLTYHSMFFEKRDLNSLKKRAIWSCILYLLFNVLKKLLENGFYFALLEE